MSLQPCRRAGAVAALGVVLAVPTLAACGDGSDSTGTSTGATGTPSATASATATPTATTTVTATAGGSPAHSTIGGETSGSSGGSGGGGGTVQCTPTVSTFSVGDSEGAAGTSYVTIVVTNASQQPCVTTGWPGVAALDSAGNQVAQAQRTGQKGPTFTLQPGEKAHADVSFNPPGGAAGACPQQPAILFTLPDNTDSTRIALAVTTCGLAVDSLQPGASD